MLHVYLEAPFAACRTFTAGWYRPTATFLTPSAAYGLLLNVAGIESRLREGEAGHDGKTPASYIKSGLPACKIALAVPADQFPRLQSIYQQLHNYPVGSSGATRAEECRGNKYNITPVRREFLSDLRVIIALDGPPELEEAVRRGLRGEGPSDRYGIPFLGDNAFLLNRLEEVTKPGERFPSVQWYERIEAESKARSRATRLTILIDRADLSRTESALFAPSESLSADAPPPTAWTPINPPVPPPDPPPKPSRKKKP